MNDPQHPLHQVDYDGWSIREELGQGQVTAPFPHCDSRILHCPGTCDVCDKYPVEQERRIRDRINFTGESDPTKIPCPADVARGPASYNQWGGNTPKKGKILGYDWAGYAVTEADPRLKDEEGNPAPVPGMPYHVNPRISAWVHKIRILRRKLFK